MGRDEPPPTHYAAHIAQHAACGGAVVDPCTFFVPDTDSDSVAAVKFWRVVAREPLPGAEVDSELSAGAGGGAGAGAGVHRVSVFPHREKRAGQCLRQKQPGPMHPTELSTCLGLYITLTFRMTLLGSGVMSAGMWNASSYEEALLHCTSQSFASSCLQRHAPLSYSLCCCSDDDLDAPGGVCEVGLHGGARGAVCRVDPGVPYLIHAADVLDVAQKDLAHEDA